MNLNIQSDGLASKNQLTASETGAGKKELAAIQGEGLRGEVNLKSLPEGAVFKGEVTDVRNSQVTIRLENGQNVSAKMDNSVELYVGQKLFFQVKENNGNLVALRPIIDQPEYNPVILRALEQAGISSNSKNILVVDSLMSEQMPLDKQTIQQLMKLTIQFPEADIKTLAQMNKLNLPLTEESIRQFEAYKQGTQQITGKLEQMTQELPTILQQLSSQGKTEQALSVNNEMLKILLNVQGGDITEKGVAGSNMQTDAQAGQTPQTNIQGGQVTPENEKMWTAQQSILSVNNAVDKNAPVSVINQLNGQENIISSEAVKTIVDPNGIDGKGQVQNSNEINSKEKIIQEMIGKEILAKEIQEPQKISEPSQLGQPIKELLNTEARAALAEQLKLGTQDTFGKQLLEGNIPVKEVMQEIQNLLKQPQTAKEIDMSRLFEGKEYRNLLDEVIKKEWFIKPEDLVKQHEVDKYYDKLREQVSQMGRLIESAIQGGQSSGLAKQSSQVREAVDFLQQMNQMYTFFQLPLKLQGKNVHSDLYVYTNKKNLSKKEGDVSILLHLDMDSLGETDVFVNLSGKKVHAKFHLPDKEGVRLVDSHMTQLTEKLTEQGFLFSAETSIRERKEDFVDDFLKRDKGQGKIKRYSFDMRA